MPNADTTSPIRHLPAQLDMLIEATPGSLLTSGLASALVAEALWGVVTPAWLVSWLAYMLATNMLRYLQARRFDKSLRDPGALQRFRNWYVAGVMAAGTGWGCSATFVYVAEDIARQSLLALVIGGVTAAGVTVYGSLITAVRYFIVLSLAPFALVHFVLGGQAHVVMGAMFCGYILYLLRLGTLVNKSLVTTLELRYEKEDLIDELKAAKQQADEINTKLKHEIRGHSKTEVQLLQAVAKAEQATRAKSDFLATMSHEIRTPMNGVLGMTELLMTTNLTSKQFRFADTIRRSGEALLAVINDILDFSKIEAGKLDIQHTVFDLRQLAEDSVSMFAEQAHRKGVELILHFPPDEHAAYRGDPDRIRQILMNLIGNAVKFTERGEIAVRVQSHDADDGRAGLRFDIVDTGIGIKAEHQRYIFDSFQQADSSTTRKFGGTGLGLAICARLTRLMNGKIGVESEPGEGSTFWFTTELSIMPADSIAGQIKNSAELHGLSVLIVDDNDTNREVLEHQLSNWQMQIDSSNSAMVALKKLRQAASSGSPFGLAILDRQMPDIDGVELAKIIRQDPLLEDTPLIMLSSINQLEETGQWFTAGIDTYVDKPVRAIELFDAISSTVRDESLSSASPPTATAGTPAPDDKLGAHILLVEDNPINQELARGMLEALGCTVVIVDNGREAVEAVADAPLDAIREPYDLILMDCQMPEMDGYQATARIRQREQDLAERDPLPIIALTANALEGDRDKCIAAGMNDYLTKPFTQKQLAATIERWIKLAVRHADTAAGQRRAAARLDQPALDNIRSLQHQGSPNFLAKIVGMFIDNAPTQLAKLQEAAATGNADLLRSTAHSLKSSSANLGANEMSALCAELETMGRDGALDDAVSKVGVLEFEFESVCEALTALLAGEAA